MIAWPLSRPSHLSLRNCPHSFYTLCRTKTKSLHRFTSALTFSLASAPALNLDIYRFIKQYMFGKYKSFSIKYLCEVGNISSPKIYYTSLVFGEDWYKVSIINCKDMIRYNISDCVSNIELCKRLELIKQLICLSCCSN